MRPSLSRAVKLAYSVQVKADGGGTPAPGTTGLYHVAILYPTRAALADALHRLIAARIALDGAADHGVSEALYLRDPDDNGVELYWDRPAEEWPRSASGELAMYTRALDLRALLAAGREPEQPGPVSTGPRDLG
jgi:catechol 2,3-dioxygenase